MTPKLYRQGDIAIFGPISKPENLTPLKSTGRAIIAYGEVTGHHHSFDASTAILYAPTKDAPECTHLEIAEAVAALEHQEHATISLPAGFYEVRRQVEYQPEAIRRVID